MNSKELSIILYQADTICARFAGKKLDNGQWYIPDGALAVRRLHTMVCELAAELERVQK